MLVLAKLIIAIIHNDCLVYICKSSAGLYATVLLYDIMWELLIGMWRLRWWTGAVVKSFQRCINLTAEKDLKRFSQPLKSA